MSVARNPQQKIREVVAGLSPRERERAVEGGVRNELHFPELKLAAGFQRVIAADLRNDVAGIPRLVRLIHAGDRHARRKGVEDQVLNAFKLRGEHDDSGSAGPVTNPCD